MATIDLTFDKINTEISVGDFVNSIDTVASGNFTTSTGVEVNIGNVDAINFTDSNGNNIAGMRITIDCANDYTHTAGNYIYFSKNSSVEQASVTGYFMSLKFQNNSTSLAELFSVGCEVAQSSK